MKGEIEFDHVSFAYPEAGENVLTDISFKAKKGQTIAVIGSTGSGKQRIHDQIRSHLSHFLTDVPEFPDPEWKPLFSERAS